MSAAVNLKRHIELKRLDKLINRATSLEQWRALSLEHDKSSGAESWKYREDGTLFDIRQIRARNNRLQELCSIGDNEEVLFALNEGLHGNMGGMGRPGLYQNSRRGTKALVDNYVASISSALAQVAAAPESEIPFEEKLDFFRRASHSYGRSALCLSGGAGLIYFHHGVVQALVEESLLPRVLSGSSAGAWMCAQIGTRTDQELKDYFVHKRYHMQHVPRGLDMLRLVAGKLPGLAENDRDDVCDSMIENLTFQEAFEHTGRYINISIAPYERHQTSRLMNAIASPNVTIRSAIRASSSVPGIVEPVALEAKDSRGRIKPYLRDRRWVDGSMSDDLPFKRLSRLFGVNHYIVSMINPLALPFLAEDPKAAPDSIKKSVRALYFQSLKEGTKAVRRWVSPVARNKADAFLGSLYNLMDQDYTGDINIILQLSQIRLRHAMFDYRSEGEIGKLIQAGRRATWPKLDQIRNATSLSLRIDAILASLEHQVIHPTAR